MESRSLPPRPIRFGQFPAIHYPGLNGDHPLAATKLEIERSLLMVGYANAHSATATVGPWRATLLSALVEGYLPQQPSASAVIVKLDLGGRGFVPTESLRALERPCIDTVADGLSQKFVNVSDGLIEREQDGLRMHLNLQSIAISGDDAAVPRMTA